MNNDKKPGSGGLDRDKIRNLIMIIVNSCILLFIYYAGVKLGEDNPVIGGVIFFAYAVAFAGFLIAYIIYNRAFTRQNVTPDMLTDKMTQQEKEEYIEDGKRRLKKSQWMITVIIPLMIPLFTDAIVMFLWDPYLSKIF